MKKSELIQKLNKIEGDFEVGIYDYLKSAEGEAGDGWYKLNSDDVYVDGDLIFLSFKNLDYDFSKCPEESDGTTPALGVFLKTEHGDFCISPSSVDCLNYQFICMTNDNKFDYKKIMDYHDVGIYRNYNKSCFDATYLDCRTAQQSLQSFLDKHNLTEPQYVYKIN